MRSRRRGPGLDVAGARPYRDGDDARAIDHRASARLSSARGDDQLVVREYLTEESARVIVAVDRSPSMALFPPGLPWLSKPTAVLEALRVILGSAGDAHCPVGLLDCRSPRSWLPPDGRASDEALLERASRPTFDAPLGALDEAITETLQIERGLHGGTFTFILSDFINPPSSVVWDAMLSRRWDVVPVVMQDPVWERSFPAVAGMLLAVADPETGVTRNVRLNQADVTERRAANEARLDGLRGRFESRGLDHVDVSSADPAEVLASFSNWALGRREGARTVR